MLKIAQYVTVGRYKTGGVLGAGSKQVVISNKTLWENAVRLLSIWKTPRTKKQFIDYVQQNTTISMSDINHLIELFEQNSFLIESSDYNSEDRFSRNKLYYNYFQGNPNTIQSNLEQSSITIIGCGGIGNHVSAILATSGINNITLVDPDVIELSNLTRQILFKESDIGKLKVEVLKDELLKRNSLLNIKCIVTEITSPNDISKLDDSDLYIISADSPSSLMDWANEACVQKQQAYINIGYINDISLVGPFYIPNKTACFNCKRYVPDDIQNEILSSEMQIINNDFKATSFAPVNNISSAMASADIIRYLGGFGDVLSKNKRIGIHTGSLKIETQEYSINENCLICQKH
ncbi:MAG: ThiF family adenylyltransferase [Pasteurella sp.]|nr:ThiF family adenylyltransferase [Pasteurella sp.]